jgi:hypothetical protein
MEWTYIDGGVLSTLTQPFCYVVALLCRRSNVVVICGEHTQTGGTLWLRASFRGQEGISGAVHLRNEPFYCLLMGKADVPYVLLLP